MSRNASVPSPKSKLHQVPIAVWWLCTALPLLLGIWVATSPKVHAATRRQFEYACMNRSVDVTKHMNILGQQGWELAGAASVPASTPPLTNPRVPTSEQITAIDAQIRAILSEAGIGNSHDATERKRGEIKASESLEARLRNALVATPPAMVWCFKRPR